MNHYSFAEVAQDRISGDWGYKGETLNDAMGKMTNETFSIGILILLFKELHSLRVLLDPEERKKAREEKERLYRLNLLLEWNQGLTGRVSKKYTEHYGTLPAGLAVKVFQFLCNKHSLAMFDWYKEGGQEPNTEAMRSDIIQRISRFELPAALARPGTKKQARYIDWLNELRATGKEFVLVDMKKRAGP